LRSDAPEVAPRITDCERHGATSRRSPECCKLHYVPFVESWCWQLTTMLSGLADRRRGAARRLRLGVVRELVVVGGGPSKRLLEGRDGELVGSRSYLLRPHPPPLDVTSRIGKDRPLDQ
jgi:hypothetical protein